MALAHCIGPLLCGFNVPIKGIRSQKLHIVAYGLWVGFSRPPLGAVSPPGSAAANCEEQLSNWQSNRLFHFLD